MEGVEHLGQYVFEMTKAKVEALKAGGGRLPVEAVGGKDEDGGEDEEGDAGGDDDADGADGGYVEADAKDEVEDMETVEGA